MNIFVLYQNPGLAAMVQCDKHVVKMILESAQMLCTAHRVLDGTEVLKPSKSGKRMVKHWELPDERDGVLYKATHVNHPCSIWVRESAENYHWLYTHFLGLHFEYAARYKKSHKSYENLNNLIQNRPDNIPCIEMTPFVLAMSDEFKTDDPVESYRNYYRSKKDTIQMKWTRREVPDWML